MLLCVSKVLVLLVLLLSVLVVFLCVMVSSLCAAVGGDGEEVEGAARLVVVPAHLPAGDVRACKALRINFDFSI